MLDEASGFIGWYRLQAALVWRWPAFERPGARGCRTVMGELGFLAQDVIMYFTVLVLGVLSYVPLLMATLIMQYDSR